MAPTYYTYHPHTGELIDQGLCDESPLEPGVWLLPGSSTLIAPPEPLPGYVVVFNTERQTWSPIEDHRGEVRWLGKSFVQITSIGRPADLDVPPLEVHDAQFTEHGIRMWINDDIIEFADDPANIARMVLADWERQGGVIRPIDPPSDEEYGAPNQEVSP